MEVNPVSQQNDLGLLIGPQAGESREYMKKDTGKASQPELLDPEFLLGVGAVLKFGATKYAPNRWREGMDWSRVYGALLRHLFAFWGGEELDEETGLPHLHHAGCCLMFLSAYSGAKRGVRYSGSKYDEHDDRP